MSEFVIPLHYSSRFQTPCLCTYISATVQDPVIMNIEHRQMLHVPLMEDACWNFNREYQMSYRNTLNSFLPSLLSILCRYIFPLFILL
jgi:hypothetical protein